MHQPSRPFLPLGLPDTDMQPSAVLINRIAEAGIQAEFGSGWHSRESGGRWTGATGNHAELLFWSPDSSRFINFSAQVTFATPGDGMFVELNGRPVGMEFIGDRLRLKAINLQEGRNILTLSTRHPPRSPSPADHRMLGAWFSQIVMEPSNRFGSEPLELAQWFERQAMALPAGSERCIGSTSHRKHGFEVWFGEGWHGNEMTHRWSGAAGRKCTFDIFSPSENTRFAFLANLASHQKNDRLKIYLNGKFIHSMQTEARVRVNNLVLRKGLNSVVLISKLMSVKPKGADSRCLGWKIHALEILPESETAAPAGSSLSGTDDQPQSLASPLVPNRAMWHPRDPQGGSMAEILSMAPLIIHTWRTTDFPLGAASALGPHLRHRKAHFLISPAWSVELPGAHPHWAATLRSYMADHPLHRFTFLGNTDREARLMTYAGFEALTVNHNCLVNEERFFPIPDIPPIFDAVYNARLAPDKRVELAAETNRLALLYYHAPRPGEPVGMFHAEHARLRALMPHATFLNKLTAEGCEKLTQPQVNTVLAQSLTGLCLSPVEGAMVASIEYLFAGLPIVSTPSLGGRDVYFDDEYCLIAEPDPRDIRDAVEQLITRAVPRDRVRSKTLERVNADRARYIKFVQSLIDEGGSHENFANRFYELTRKKSILHWRSMSEFVETVIAALPPPA